MIAFNSVGFKEGNESVDRYLLEQAGGSDASVIIVPSLNGAHYSAQSLGERGTSWFKQLGARNIEVIQINNRQAAEDSRKASRLAKANLICLAGSGRYSFGFEDFSWLKTLKGSICWDGIAEALEQGTILSGAHGSAELLPEYDCSFQDSLRVVEGLGFVPDVIFVSLAGYFTFRGKEVMKQLLQRKHQNIPVITVEESASVILQGDKYRVLGNGLAKVYQKGEVFSYQTGQIFRL